MLKKGSRGFRAGGCAANFVRCKKRGLSRRKAYLAVSLIFWGALGGFGGSLSAFGKVQSEPNPSGSRMEQARWVRELLASCDGPWEQRFSPIPIIQPLHHTEEIESNTHAFTLEDGPFSFSAAGSLNSDGETFPPAFFWENGASCRLLFEG